MSAKFNFKTLDQPFEADWPVTVPVPQDGGEVVEVSFMARFRLLTPKRLEELSSNASDADALYRDMMPGLAASEAEPLTDDQFKEMFGRPYIRNAILSAYRDFTNGVAAKN